MFEIYLKTKSRDWAAAGLLRALLNRSGVAQDQICELQDRQKIRVFAYFRSQKKARDVISAIRKLKLKGFIAGIRRIDVAELQARWKYSLRPFAISRKFDIVPLTAIRRYRKSSRVPIYLDTTLAFGTGLHETTRFMAQLIERCEGQIDDFLDIGTGSGILAMVAAKCGAKRITALDNDPACIPVARQNFKANRMVSCVTKVADVAEYSPGRQFDFVAANLFSSDLIRLRKKLVALTREGKFLAISGIALDHVSAVKQAYAKLALACVKVCRGKQWAAILYQRTSRLASRRQRQ